MDDAAKQRAAVKAIRDAIAKPVKVPMHKLQQASFRDPGITAPIWVSSVDVPAPNESDLRNVLFDALVQTGDDVSRPALGKLEYEPRFKAEWVGMRADGKVDKASELSDQQKYENLEHERKSSCTILYLQGGSFVAGTASTGRRLVTELCRATGGRGFSIHYRLCPQHPFPQNLLDVIVAYFYLIAPPPGSYHKPVPPSSIVLAGESAGSVLALGLIQFLLYLQQHSSSSTVQRLCHGRKPSQLMPAGCAFLSPTPDMSGAMHLHDPADTPDWMIGGPHWERDYFPADHLWPTKPPQSTVFCNDALLAHPMISPVTRKDWAGAPPVWLAMGDEGTMNSAKVWAKIMAENGIGTKYVRYEGMPHIFPMLLPKLPQTRHVMKEWGRGCKEIYEGNAAWLNNGNKSEVVTVQIGNLEQSRSSIATLTDISFEKSLKSIYAKREEKMDPRNAWTGPKVTKASL